MALFVYQPQGVMAHVCVACTWLALIYTLLIPLAGGQQGTLEQFNFSLSVRENSPNGTLVGEVRSSQFSPPYAKWMPQATDNRTINSFIVDLQTGRITTKGELDREEQEHHTIIISTSFVSPKLVIVDIRVLDVNDITPTFPNQVLNFSIPESAPKDHKIPLGSVRDEDLGENTTQTVEIVAGNEDHDFLLQIKNSSNVDKILDLVVNTYQLDYERINTYSLIIRATDGGSRSSEMRVNINIIDQNDNEPIFNTSKYSAKITENVTVGSLIIQVHATDIDSGENSRISYFIDHRSDPEEYFTINVTTGWVRVNKPLDYETRDRFSLTLEARDNGVSPQMGTAALDIIVENINEQPANISLQFQAAFPDGHVPEDTQVGTLLAVITVDDPDIGVSSNVEVSLYNSDDYFTLKKQGDQLGLYVKFQLDRETVASLEMTLQVTDSGNPPLRANKTFKVTIEDVNDNSPVFAKTEYVADVDETVEVGKEVLKVSATDKDAGRNARITYTIQDSSQHMGWFSVNSSTGIITTRATMDCELSHQPVLVILATDGGEPPRVGSAQVTISVRDVNDKEPEFETSFYSIKIAENRRVGDCVLTGQSEGMNGVSGVFRPRSGKLAQIPIVPEIEIYIHLLVLIYLIDTKQFERAVECSELLVKKLNVQNRRTMDMLSAKCYFYYSRAYELTNKLDGIRVFLHARLRTATLHSDYEGQATLINLLLRNYLHYNLYEQADKLVSKSTFPETASNNEWARFLFYLGRIKAAQLEYSEAHKHLLQAMRKAPQHSAMGFKQTVQKLAITVELLLGEIPDRSVFRQQSMRKSLTPYFQLTQAVRGGNLQKFSETLAKFGSKFQTENTYTLIVRLRHNVIKTGVRMISLSYSRISLQDIAQRLTLDSPEDAEFIVAKAIRDGVIEATIDHENGYVQSKETGDVYSTKEPMAAFHQRISFCLDIHNQSIKAMRFPPKSYNKDLESAEERREREQQELESAKEIAEEDFDGFP